MPKRSVVHIVQHLQPGGIETMALDLIGSDPDRYIVSLEGTADDAIKKWPRLKNIRSRLIFMNKQSGVRPGTVVALCRVLCQLQTVAVHTHHVGPLLYGGLAARLAGINRIIHTEHDAWHLNEPARRKLQSWIVKLVRPVYVADASAVARSVRRNLPGTRPFVITNGIDTKRFQPASQERARLNLRLPLQAKIIGCAARLEEVKGHDVLLDAFADLDDASHLALAGDGSQRQSLFAQAKQLGIADRVHFLGAIDSMADFYNAIDVFCLPSRQEGMPLSPLEAQACGVPVVASDVGAVKTATCDKTGRLVPAQCVASLRDALADALVEPPHETPRRFVLREADLRNTRNAYEELYAV